MSVQMLESMKQQAAHLSAPEKVALANFLLEDANGAELLPIPTVDEETARRKRRERDAWMKDAGNREQYGGQYVALDGNKLIATGRNYAEARSAARRAGFAKVYVDFVLPPDYAGFAGGW
jgi:hypothetical protein